MSDGTTADADGGLEGRPGRRRRVGARRGRSDYGEERQHEATHTPGPAEYRRHVDWKPLSSPR